jgi:general L-amino acid transport system substrate-binding protein
MRMRRLTIAVLAFLGLGLGLAPAASAGPILDRVRAEGLVRCGGVERPGLIAVAAGGGAAGLELDLCRAIAAVVLGPGGRLEFRRYDSDAAFAKARAGADDVAFLTGAEIVDNGLAGQLIPGPTVFEESTAIMVPQDSPVRHAEELAGQPICFALGGAAQRQLEAWFAARRLEFIRMGFQEEVEMNDGYAVGYCKGLAGETTTLAQTRGGGPGRSNHRILPEPLAVYPILAATGVADGEWAAIVAWTIHTLMRAEAPRSDWAAGGVESLPIHAPELGLEAGWQDRLVGLVGSYAAIYDRNLGAGSPLGLPRGVNAASGDGGLIAAPWSE